MTVNPEPPRASSPRPTAFNQMASPFKADDITIDDPEFKRPPGKINKLALAIKMLCTSFWSASRVNNPETDRSARVETIRSRVFTVTYTTISILCTVLSAVTLFAVSLAGAALLGPQPNDLALMGILMITIISAFVVAGIGLLITQGVSYFMTSAISAAVDTREKLTEITGFTSPKERFLKKYQRMEESLSALQTMLYDNELARIDNIKYRPIAKETKLKIQTEQHARLEAARLEAGFSKPEKEQWYHALQRRCLMEWYGFDTGKIKDAIGKTRDWLDRAAKQKELLTHERIELRELNSIPNRVSRSHADCRQGSDKIHSTPASDHPLAKLPEVHFLMDPKKETEKSATPIVRFRNDT
ncbi:hypothetical protein [Endozoicomonas sp. SCSIO W0465]|uniref:hypothetical protein n=1 Tax=Endozoicomonas sp. SCSIO W0465 TaxID=2918516 RepID=UPI0020756E59|nr:hypothetical protein [Endozoicomonas sp. SCSIO W0465]USE37312.1 hypothetical protein MJO57_03535 [Endozoicomonas sp. SCSIO W0465]